MNSVWRRMGLGNKLALTNFLLVALVLTGCMLAIGYFLSQSVEQRATEELSAKAKLLHDLIDSGLLTNTINRGDLFLFH
jgi:hypothetical protein